jgi:transposase
MTCWRFLTAWNEADVWDRLHAVLPVDRARPDSKDHVVTDGQGIPLTVSLTGENRNDITQLLPLVDRIPAVGQAGRSASAPARCAPGCLPLRRRAHNFPAARLPPPSHPPGTTRRHPQAFLSLTFVGVFKLWATPISHAKP